MTGRRRRRRGASLVFRGACLLSLVAVLGPAAWLLGGVLARAVPHWSWSVLTTTTHGTSGGLLNAIVGTLILMVGVFVLAGAVGVLGGIWLAELSWSRRALGPVTALLRGSLQVLAGFPSIVLGYVGYVALVVGLHWGYSLLPALLILSIMVVPYIARSTETALRHVPTGYREGAAALGMSTGFALRKVLLRASLPGIVTGILLALAIAVGETAPLLYTAGWSSSMPSAQLVHSGGFPYLTYPVWAFFQVPQQSAQNLSSDAALLLVVIVLLLLIGARLVVARTQRHAAPTGR